MLSLRAEGEPDVQVQRTPDARFAALPGYLCTPRNHVTIAGAGHFLQEDRGEELARVVVDLIAKPGARA